MRSRRSLIPTVVRTSLACLLLTATGSAAVASAAAASPVTLQGTVAPAACGAPAVVSSSATDVAPGVHDTKVIVYTAVIDDSCLDTGAHNVTVELYKDGVGYADELATYTGLQGTDQVWQASFDVDPLHSPTSDLPLWTDGFAGIWGSTVEVPGTNGYVDAPGDSVLVRRFSRIDSTDASEPTPKGATETVTGKLVRANWEDNLYHGNMAQPVDLEFRTLTGSYAKVLTVTSDATGQLRATTTATVDGCYRWDFHGNDETPPATAPGDCITVT